MVDTGSTMGLVISKETVAALELSLDSTPCNIQTASGRDIAKNPTGSVEIRFSGSSKKSVTMKRTEVFMVSTRNIDLIGMPALQDARFILNPTSFETPGTIEYPIEF